MSDLLARLRALEQAAIPNAHDREYGERANASMAYKHAILNAAPALLAIAEAAKDLELGAIEQVAAGFYVASGDLEILRAALGRLEADEG